MLTVNEDKTELLKDTDSLTLEVYYIDSELNSYFNDLIEPRYSTAKTGKDLSELIEVKKGIPFYTNSEYILKSDRVIDTLSFEIFLQDSISDSELKDLKADLEKKFKGSQIRYISKKEAGKIASKELGIDYNSIFEEDIFPASLLVRIKNSKKNIQKIEDWIKEFKGKEYIDEIVDDKLYKLKFLYRIKT